MAGVPKFNPGGVPLGARLARFASTRLLHEWSQLQPWEAPPVYEVRLGPTPLTSSPGIITPAQENMLRNFNRYADMIGITAHEIQVIEAKMQFDPGAISQVLHYVDLVHYTPLLREFSGRMVVPVILVAFNDPGLHQRAAAQGIRVIQYTPSWASDWLVKRYGAKKILADSAD